MDNLRKALQNSTDEELSAIYEFHLMHMGLALAEIKARLAACREAAEDAHYERSRD